MVGAPADTAAPSVVVLDGGPAGARVPLPEGGAVTWRLGHGGPPVSAQVEAGPDGAWSVVSLWPEPSLDGATLTAEVRPAHGEVERHAFVLAVHAYTL